jgi:hypothetical protein
MYKYMVDEYNSIFLHGTSVLGKLSDAGEPNLEPIKNQAT